MRFSDEHMVLDLEGFVSFLGMGARIFREIWAKQAFLPTWECNSKTQEVSIPFSKLSKALLWCVT